MTLALLVRTAEWNRHIQQVAERVVGLVPVVKGNGYGFGRADLAEIAAPLSPYAAVGTVFEVAEVPSHITPVVLTPTLAPPPHLREDAILTLGHIEHLHAAAQQPGRRVLIKIRTSTNRHGVTPEQAASVIGEARARGLHVVGVSLHPPIAGSSTDHAVEVEQILAHIEPTLPAWVSHIDIDDYNELRHRHPTRAFHLRLGTALWHADKSSLHLRSDVLDTRDIAMGEFAGYRLLAAPADGTLVIVGCGTAHGVSALPDGSSPFHHARHRMQLIEPPHMHSSICLVPQGQPVPAIGEWVDVQRPLISTAVDFVEWI